GAVNESDPSLSHPPGFTPEASRQVDDPIGEGIDIGFIKESSPSVNSKVMNNSEEVHVKEVAKGNSEFRHSHNHKDIYGTWISNNSKVLIVVVYAPQSLALK
nr:hypothetical protein [Tanacetum cinerariifolium]